MPGHTESIVIERPLADVFAYMDDVSREREWQPHLRAAEQIPTGPTTVGAQRRYESEFMGKRLHNTYVVRTYDPGRHVVVESTPDSAVNGKTEIRWESAGSGTRVTMSMEGEPAGALRFVPAALLRRAFEKEMREALGRLKDLLESVEGMRS